MTVIQRERHIFHPHQLSYKTPSCEKSTQTLFTATSHSWSKLLDTNTLLKNIIYANRLYVACCLYTVSQHSTILFMSYREGCLIWTHRLPSHSKLIFTYNTRNAGSKSHLRFCVKLFFVPPKYIQLNPFQFRQEFNMFTKVSNSFLNSSMLFCNQTRRILISSFCQKKYMHKHIRKS